MLTLISSKPLRGRDATGRGGDGLHLSFSFGAVADDRCGVVVLLGPRFSEVYQLRHMTQLNEDGALLSVQPQRSLQLPHEWQSNFKLEHQANAHGLVGRRVASGLAPHSIFAVNGPANVPASVVAGWNGLRRAEFAGRADGAV
jgi:hypothetical protein